jgi:hypothetical protein
MTPMSVQNKKGEMKNGGEFAAIYIRNMSIDFPCKIWSVVDKERWFSFGPRVLAGLRPEGGLHAPPVLN